MQNQNYEGISKENYNRLNICPKCHCLIYNYQTKNGGNMWVSVLEGMTFHRFGNNNNYVPIHDCNIDKRESQNHQRKIINCIKVSEEIKNKTNNFIQQQALTLALNYKNVRSTFKKAMKQQANDFMNGNSKYNNPFSYIQAMHIILSSTQKIDYNEYQELKNIEYKKEQRILNDAKIEELKKEIIEYESIVNEPSMPEVYKNIFERKIKAANEKLIYYKNLNNY